MDNNNYPISREDAIKQVLNAISSYSEGLPETGYSAVGTVSDTDTGCTIDIKLTPSGKPVGSVQLTFTEDNNLHTMIVEGYTDKDGSNTIRFPKDTVLDFTTPKYMGAPFSFFLKMTVKAFIYLKTFAEKVCKLADTAYHMGSRYEIPQVSKGRAHTVITLYNNLGANSKATQLAAASQKTSGVGSVETYAYRSISIQYRYGDNQISVGVTDNADDINSFKLISNVKYEKDADLSEIFVQSANKKNQVANAIETVASGNRIKVDMIGAMDETGNQIQNSKLVDQFSHYKPYSAKPANMVANAINAANIVGVNASTDMSSNANLFVTCTEQHESKSGEPLYVCQVLNKTHTPVMTFLIKDSKLHTTNATCDVQWQNNMRHKVAIGPNKSLPSDIAQSLRRYAKVYDMETDFADQETRRKLFMYGLDDNTVDTIMRDENVPMEHDEVEFTPDDTVAQSFGKALEKYINSHKRNTGVDVPEVVEINDAPIGNGVYRLYSGYNNAVLGNIQCGRDSKNNRVVNYIYPKSGRSIKMKFSAAGNMVLDDDIIWQIRQLQPKLNKGDVVLKYNHNAANTNMDTVPKDTKSGIPLFDEDI